MAEETGLIVPLGDWVLREACRQCAEWTRSGLATLKVAVNVASQQFRKGRLSESVTSALEDAGLSATQLELEVTESSMLEDEEIAINALDRLKSRGVSVAIDDFGTGYSSLSYLQRLPLDSLKIDQSFIAELAHGEENNGIVTAIITMAHSLGLKVVAEGVEDPQLPVVLAAWGCDQAQGHFYSPAVPPDEIPCLLQAQPLGGSSSEPDRSD